MKRIFISCLTLLALGSLSAEKHWLSTILKDNSNHLIKHPSVDSQFVAIEESLISIEKSQTAWSPILRLSVNESKDQRVSTTRTDGQGIVKDDGRNLSSEVIKKFDQGTDLSFNVSQNDSSSTSANRLSNDITNTSFSFKLSQALLKGNKRSFNRFEVSQASFNKLDRDDQLQDAIETQLNDYARKLLDLAEALNNVSIRKQHVELSMVERKRAAERVDANLAPRRSLLSHQRNVLNQEIQLKEIERNINSIKKEMKVTWPELSIPSDNTLLGLLQKDLATPSMNKVAYKETRDGKRWERNSELDERRLKTMRHRKLDSLDLELDYRQRGTGTHAGDSWSQFGDGDSRRWSIGLVYEHRIGRSNDRLNWFSAKLTQQKNDHQRHAAERKWSSDLMSIQEDAKNTRASLSEKKSLLKLYREERQLYHEELKQGLARLEEVFSVDRSLLNSELNLLRDRKNLLLIDLRIRQHYQTLLELMP